MHARNLAPGKYSVNLIYVRRVNRWITKNAEGGRKLQITSYAMRRHGRLLQCCRGRCMDVVMLLRPLFCIFDFIMSVSKLKINGPSNVISWNQRKILRRFHGRMTLTITYFYQRKQFLSHIDITHIFNWSVDLPLASFHNVRMSMFHILIYV